MKRYEELSWKSDFPTFFIVKSGPWLSYAPNLSNHWIQ